MKFWAVLALAASVAAVPFEGASLHKRAGETHIGYRIVAKSEADLIAANDGKAVQSVGTGGRQLGDGLYISPAFQDFADFDTSKGTPWDCNVTADTDAWDGFKKAWIPQFFQFPEDCANNQNCEELRLWTQVKRNNRKRFLAHLDAESTPENTVLFSKVLGDEDKTQALIPPAIIKMGVISLKCAERGTDENAEIGSGGPVDWNTESMPGWNMGSDAM